MYSCMNMLTVTINRKPSPPSANTTRVRIVTLAAYVERRRAILLILGTGPQSCKVISGNMVLNPMKTAASVVHISMRQKGSTITPPTHLNGSVFHHWGWREFAITKIAWRKGD